MSLHLAEMGNGESFLPPRLGGGGVCTHISEIPPEQRALLRGRWAGASVGRDG